MLFLTVSCLLVLLAWIGARSLLQRTGHARQIGFMKPLLWIFRVVFGCHHRQLSRVFTIRKRTYQVCFECGQEFEYSWALMRCLPSNVADNAYAPLNSARDAEVPVI